MYHGLLIQKVVKRNLVQEPVLGKTRQYAALPPAACVPSTVLGSFLVWPSTRASERSLRTTGGLEATAGKSPGSLSVNSGPCRSRLEAGGGQGGPLGNVTTAPCSQCPTAPALFPEALRQDPTAYGFTPLTHPAPQVPSLFWGSRQTGRHPQYREMYCDWRWDRQAGQGGPQPLRCAC